MVNNNKHTLGKTPTPIPDKTPTVSPKYSFWLSRCAEICNACNNKDLFSTDPQCYDKYCIYKDVQDCTLACNEMSSIPVLESCIEGFV